MLPVYVESVKDQPKILENNDVRLILRKNDMTESQLKAKNCLVGSSQQCIASNEVIG